VRTPRIHLPARDDGFLAGVEFEWLERDERRDDEGRVIYGTGAMFHAGGTALTWDDPRFEEAGVRLFAVAGVSFRPEAMGGVRVGSLLQLEPEPSNPHDPHAIAVHAAEGGRQIGYVPRPLTGTVSRLVAADARAVVHFEWRRDDGAVCGLRALAAPAPFVARLQRFVGRRRRVA
jgi:HIRAN domain-containing protein